VSRELGLHNTARRYLIDRVERQTGSFSEGEPGRDVDATDSQHWADELSARHRFLASLLVEVERTDPDNAPDVSELRLRLAAAADHAYHLVTRDLPDCHVAVLDELAKAQAVFEGSVDGLAHVSLLPYRRVLTDEESVALRAQAADRWIQGNLWHPMWCMMFLGTYW